MPALVMISRHSAGRNERAIDSLPGLSPGDFVAVGPAFSESPTTLRV